VGLLTAPTTVFVDARLPSQFEAGHVPGAVNLPVDEFEAWYRRVRGHVQGASRLICYCDSISCDEGARLSALLARAEHDHVLLMFEGLEGWQQAGCPVESVQGKHSGR
jgi:rhodanese-related sulfurtransferase